MNTIENNPDVIKSYYVRDFKRLNNQNSRDISIVSALINVDGTIHVRASWCFKSTSETFRKKLGRSIAIERLLRDESTFTVEFVPREISHNVIIEQILEEIMKKESTPNKFRNVIKTKMKIFEFYKKLYSNTANMNDVILNKFTLETIISKGV